MLPVIPRHLPGRGIHVPIVIYLSMSKFIAAWGIMQPTMKSHYEKIHPRI
jgi:hypothetical protein